LNSYNVKNYSTINSKNEILETFGGLGEELLGIVVCMIFIQGSLILNNPF